MDEPDLIPAGLLRGKQPVHTEERSLKAAKRRILGSVLVRHHEQVDKAHGLPHRLRLGDSTRIPRHGRLLSSPPGHTWQPPGNADGRPTPRCRPGRRAYGGDGVRDLAGAHFLVGCRSGGLRRVVQDVWHGRLGWSATRVAL